MADVAGLPERRQHGDLCTEKPRLERIEDNLCATSEDVREIKAALIGTFERGGICQRTESAEADLRLLWSRVEEMAKGLVSIGEQVRILEAVKTRNERMSWVLIAAIVTQVVMVVRESIMGG